MYFKAFKTQNCGKRSDVPAISRFKTVPNEKGSGANYNIHPAVAPVSRMSVINAAGYIRICSSGGQNLAALCAAAGQNLTAVGSSHSLTETVHLGTMTTAGLVGTLHTLHLLIEFFYARQPFQAAATQNYDHSWSF